MQKRIKVVKRMVPPVTIWQLPEFVEENIILLRLLLAMVISLPEAGLP